MGVGGARARRPRDPHPNPQVRGRGCRPRVQWHHLSRSRGDAVAVRTARAVMAPRTRPPPLLLLLLLLPPPPATRALVPRISLPLGECGRPRGARAPGGEGRRPRVPRADVAVTKEAGGALETWGSLGPLLLGKRYAEGGGERGAVGAAGSFLLFF